MFFKPPLNLMVGSINYYVRKNQLSSWQVETTYFVTLFKVKYEYSIASN